MGIGLASMTFFGSFYYRPWDVPPGVRPGDPQWISAWYLPMLVGGCGTFLIGLIYMVYREIRLFNLLIWQNFRF